MSEQENTDGGQIIKGAEVNLPSNPYFILGDEEDDDEE